VQWIEAEMACGSKPSYAGDGMEIELLGGGARLRVRDERDAELAAVVLRAMGGGVCCPATIKNDPRRQLEMTPDDN
jgi:hypothetical protein